MTDARLVKTVALMVEDDRPRRRPARRSDDIAERCAVTVTVTVTVTEALVMRPLLEDRGRTAHHRVNPHRRNNRRDRLRPRSWGPIHYWSPNLKVGDQQRIGPSQLLGRSFQKGKKFHSQ